MTYKEELNKEFVEDFMQHVSSARISARTFESFETLLGRFPLATSGIDWGRSQLLISESLKSTELQSGFIKKCQDVLMPRQGATLCLAADQGLQSVLEVPVEDLCLAFETACREIIFGFWITDFQDDRNWVIDIRMARAAFCGMPPAGGHQ